MRKLIKSQDEVVAYKELSISYGRFLKSRKYKIELKPVLFPPQVSVPIYFSLKKPWIRNLVLLDLLLWPFNLLLSFLFILLVILVTIFSPLHFFYQVLVKESFIVQDIDRIGGYMSLLYFIIILLLYINSLL